MQIMDRDDLIKLDAEYEAARRDTFTGAVEALGAVFSGSIAAAAPLLLTVYLFVLAVVFALYT